VRNSSTGGENRGENSELFSDAAAPLCGRFTGCRQTDRLEIITYLLVLRLWRIWPGRVLIRRGPSGGLVSRERGEGTISKMLESRYPNTNNT
jgi:hypothetical protein